MTRLRLQSPAIFGAAQRRRYAQQEEERCLGTGRGEAQVEGAVQEGELGRPREERRGGSHKAPKKRMPWMTRVLAHGGEIVRRL
jgi:hypothetical protein